MPPISSVLRRRRMPTTKIPDDLKIKINLGARKFCQRGSNFDNFFFNLIREEGSKYDYFWGAIIGPPANRHLNGVSLAGRWWPNNECWLGSFVIFRGLGSVLLRDPIFLWFSTPPPFWSAHGVHKLQHSTTLERTTCQPPAPCAAYAYTWRLSLWLSYQQTVCETHFLQISVSSSTTCI